MSEDNTPTDDTDAYSRVQIILPQLKEWSTKSFYDHEEMIFDYETLDELNTAVVAARKALFKLTDNINKYDRLERTSKVEYDRAHRRAYISATGKTDTAKRIRADLACEDLENAYIYNEQVKKELTLAANAVRLELQTLQAVGNNLRQQMKME